MLRLIASITGRGATLDPRQLDDELLDADVQRVAGPLAPQILRALAGVGPERLIDLALRGGPYGDQFGLVPDGLSLAKLELAPDGIDLGALTPRIPEVLRTPSGRVELAPASLISDLDRLRGDLVGATPELVIIGRRQLRSNNSWMHNLPTLAKGPARCVALVHPADASRLGLRTGGRARITANGRSIDVEVELTEEMMPGVVSLPHGWGHDLPGIALTVAAARPGVSLNALLDDTLRDPLSGNAVLSGIAITMAPL